MDILSIAIIIFIILETVNVVMLYFMPDSKQGNGVGVFNAYKKAKKDPDVYALVKYLIHWIAGTKLIFITLLIVILCIGDTTTKIFSVSALILSISSFFWKLYPAIRKMDKNNQITPKGYSKKLVIMIFSFIGMFIIALVVCLSVVNKG